VTTQGDTGRTAEPAEGEPEFPGPRRRSGAPGGFDDLLWESGEAPDAGSPEFGPEWWPEPDAEPDALDASGGWPVPRVPGAREGRRRIVEAYGPVAGEHWGPRPDARGAAPDPPVHDTQLHDAETDFVPFPVTGDLAPELGVTARDAPVSMLAEWFGEPDTVPAAPPVEHDPASGSRRPSGRRRRAVAPPRADGGRAGDVAEGAAEGRHRFGAGEFVAWVVVPVLVFVGLLHVFGSARAAAMSEYLGFEESVLDRGPLENLVDGLRPLYRPLVVVVGVLLAVLVAHPGVVAWARRHRRTAASCAWLLRCAWFAVPIGAWAASRSRPGVAAWWGVVLPGSVAVGVVVAAYGVLLSRRIGAHRRGGGLRGRSIVLTGAVVVLCLVWASASYGHVSGRAQGREVVRELPSRTGVVLYSTRDLGVRAENGIRVEEETGASRRYRYTGLRLLRRSSGTLFLLPEGWSWQRPRLLVVHEDARLRVEYERTR